jgi:dethiobiotin synthetase
LGYVTPLTRATLRKAFADGFDIGDFVKERAR